MKPNPSTDIVVDANLENWNPPKNMFLYRTCNMFVYWTTLQLRTNLNSSIAKVINKDNPLHVVHNIFYIKMSIKKRKISCIKYILYMTLKLNGCTVRVCIMLAKLNLVQTKPVLLGRQSPHDTLLHTLLSITLLPPSGKKMVVDNKCNRKNHCDCNFN